MNQSSLEVQVCGWWGSANLGDRFQPLAIAKHLYSLNIPFVAMGYTPTPTPTYTLTYPDLPEENLQLQIHTPDPTNSREFIVAVTGSLADYSYSTHLLRDIVRNNKAFKRLVIWGGFQDINFDLPIYRPPAWDWLADPRVLFIARSIQDLQYLRKLTPLPVNSILGGDPMCTWIPDGYESYKNPQGPKAMIISDTWASRFPSLLPEMLSRVAREMEEWKVGCFDGVADHALLQQKTYPIKSLQSPLHFLEWLEGSSRLVSTRLHAAVLGSGAGMPSIAIGANEKYYALGQYATELGGLFPVTLNFKTAINDPIKIDHALVQNYVSMSKQTLKDLVNFLVR